MHPQLRSKPPVNYRNISLALLAIVFIQATVIIQLYFVSSSCQNAASVDQTPSTSSSTELNSISSLSDVNSMQNDKKTIINQHPKVLKKSVCGTLSYIPIGEENALNFNFNSQDISGSLIYPTTGLTLGGDMISDGPVTAIAVRNTNYDSYPTQPFHLNNEQNNNEDWIFACVNREYIKMLHVSIKKQSNSNDLIIYTVAAGYMNVHALHSFGNSYNIEHIQTSDLSSTIVKHAWKHRVDQETHGYQLNTFNYCVGTTIETVLPTTKFDATSLLVSIIDAHSIVVTGSPVGLSGSQITNGPIKCKAYRSSNVSPSSEKALWLLAAVNDHYIKMVEITISHAEAVTDTDSGGGSLSVYISNSGYTTYKEFGTADTEALTGRIVNAAWNKMIPNSYDVTGLSYYVKAHEDDKYVPSEAVSNAAHTLFDIGA